jgi:hypothetical protein
MSSPIHPTMLVILSTFTRRGEIRPQMNGCVSHKSPVPHVFAFFLRMGGKPQPSIGPFIRSGRTESKDLLFYFLVE